MASLGYGGCHPGEAGLTPGFGLQAKWVIHAVGLIWAKDQRHEAGTLASARRSSFPLARSTQSLRWPSRPSALGPMAAP